ERGRQDSLGFRPLYVVGVIDDRHVAVARAAREDGQVRQVAGQAENGVARAVGPTLELPEAGLYDGGCPYLARSLEHVRHRRMAVGVDREDGVVVAQRVAEQRAGLDR